MKRNGMVVLCTWNMAVLNMVVSRGNLDFTTNTLEKWRKIGFYLLLLLLLPPPTAATPAAMMTLHPSIVYIAGVH